MCAHPVELSIEVASHNDLGALVLPDDVLGEVDHCVSPLTHDVLVARFKVHVQDVNFFASQLDLGPVEVGSKGLDLPVALQVAEGDAPA